MEDDQVVRRNGLWLQWQCRGGWAHRCCLGLSLHLANTQFLQRRVIRARRAQPQFGQLSGGSRAAGQVEEVSTALLGAAFHHHVSLRSLRHARLRCNGGKQRAGAHGDRRCAERGGVLPAIVVGVKGTGAARGGPGRAGLAHSLGLTRRIVLRRCICVRFRFGFPLNVSAHIVCPQVFLARGGCFGYGLGGDCRGGKVLAREELTALLLPGAIVADAGCDLGAPGLAAAVGFGACGGAALKHFALKRRARGPPGRQ